MNNDLEQSILNRVDKLVKKTEEYLKSDEIICACYLYKYIETGKLEYYTHYHDIFDKLDDIKKLIVARTFVIFSINNLNKKVDELVENNENSENNKKLIKIKERKENE